MDNPFTGHPLQGNGRLAVMDIRTGDDGTDGDAAVGNIQMQLVALPLIVVALAVSLASPTAQGVQFTDRLFN